MELTVEELAERSGASVRTIRWYQSEGLLPAPHRRGRQACYDADHLARMEAIADLQGRGLRLTAIAELLAEAEADETSVADWLGLGRRMVEPWSDDRPELLEAADLHGRLEGTALEPDDLVGVGLVERRTDTTPVVYLVPSPGLLDLALRLAALGIDLATAAALRGIIEDRLGALATALVAEFTDRVSLTHLAEAGPGALGELLDELQPLTRRTVDLVFAHEMEKAQRSLLDAAVVAAQPPEEHP